MFSRAQEARVLDVLRDCPAEAIRTYCLEPLASASAIPPAHAADLIVFLRIVRTKGDGQTQYGGFCHADGHDTEELLVWRRESTGEGGRLSA